MAMTEDLSAFFNPSEFAVQTTLAGVAVRGIFDNAYQLAEVGGAGMACTQPTLTLPTAEVPERVITTLREYIYEPTNPIDLLMEVNGTTYKVVAHEPDGTGVSVLLLEVAA